MSAPTIYDRIGSGYAQVRQPDDRVAMLLHEALGDAVTIVNIGAGTGNYEAPDRFIVAVEPSAVMIAQRGASSTLAVQAAAESLPFPARQFDAAMAVSTVHHWRDLAAGLAEMRRVAGRSVIYFSEPATPGQFWLTDEYFPEILDMPTNRSAPIASDIVELLGGTAEVVPFAVPSDFTDGAGAFWARPECYCRPEVQRSLSMFALLSPHVVERGTQRLRSDLESGTWDQRHGHLRTQFALDLGYRFVIADHR